MTNLNQEIGQRLRGLRELCELDAAAFAARAGVDQAELLAYESGAHDIPVSVLHNVAQAFGVSTTELMTGESAKLHQYCVVRGGGGVSVNRREEYDYRSLAYNFAARRMEPMYITIQPGGREEPFHLNSHSGQEFHYCLEGAFAIRIGEHIVTLEQGDSIYFDSSYPHGMKALGGAQAKSLVIITM
ncbi:MAG: cupin domain-containing protein [Oscillospiraceae bacterium]|jgi:transcriptional regulator with XRE-family HTH domain|nr:cupin domain-containing protein [Oscillospiraceae bacterium]